MLLVAQGQAAQSCTAEAAAEAVAGRDDAAVCTQAAAAPQQLVPCYEVAQAAVALRAPLTPAALGPFGLMLLSVAVLPLWRPHWWDDNANRLKVPFPTVLSRRLCCSQSDLGGPRQLQHVRTAPMAKNPLSHPLAIAARSDASYLGQPLNVRSNMTGPSRSHALQVAAVLGGPVALWALLHAPPLLLHTLTEYCTFIALLGSMYAITGASAARQSGPCQHAQSFSVWDGSLRTFHLLPFCP